ncbi:hypothetical protein [Mycobacteroides abscessus]|uniref:hypothetical protein n=1 Tax=Mycobacteroides abscessus TaxID=36809 RepID=UPI0012FFDD14|nr:hypothetical protein [Mycobacteroides abscessus]
MTMIYRDGLRAGMLTASAAAPSWLESVIEAQELAQSTSREFGQSRCFRSSRYQHSARLIGERPDRKQGPENNSHKNHSIAVSAARNVD